MATQNMVEHFEVDQQVLDENCWSLYNDAVISIFADYCYKIGKDPETVYNQSYSPDGLFSKESMQKLNESAMILGVKFPDQYELRHYDALCEMITDINFHSLNVPYFDMEENGNLIVV